MSAADLRLALLMWEPRGHADRYGCVETGWHEFAVDPDDPLRGGFLVR